MLMLVQVYGDNGMKKTAVYKWVKRFSEGRECVTEDESSGRPATSRTGENISNVRQIVRENRRLTVRSIAEHRNIDRKTVRKILTEDLDMRKVCAKMLPKEHTEKEIKERFLATKATHTHTNTHTHTHKHTQKHRFCVYRQTMSLPASLARRTVIWAHITHCIELIQSKGLPLFDRRRKLIFYSCAFLVFWRQGVAK